jgi:hypothetical protein
LGRERNVVCVAVTILKNNLKLKPLTEKNLLPLTCPK